MSQPDLEHAITDIAEELASYNGTSGVYQLGGVAALVMRQALRDPVFRADLFRLVDVFPALADPAEVTRHVREYLDPRAPRWMALGQSVASKIGLGQRALARLTRANIIEMANQFILGTELEEIARKVGAMGDQGYLTTVDLLGEKILTYPESDRYLGRITEIHERLRVVGPFLAAKLPKSGPPISISIKPSALTPHYSPMARARAVPEVHERLLPLLTEAQAAGTLVFLDMEHYDTYEVTLELFRSLVADPNLAELKLGIVLQAYLRRHVDELTTLLEWLAPHASEDPRLWVRLVKGAYWDTEFAQASSESHEPPVFVDKADSDLSYEASIRLLLDHARTVHPAFASHNLRSLAYAIAYARAQGLDPTRYELQMLYGMAEPLSSALVARGESVRIYTPVGELLPGMSYLVRRLLENTSNSSFVRARFGSRESVAKLVAPPRRSHSARAPEGYPEGYRHEPTTEYRLGTELGMQTATIARVNDELSSPRRLTCRVAGAPELTGPTSTSVSPTDPTRVLAEVHELDAAMLDDVVARTIAAARPLAAMTPAERAGMLRRTAEVLRRLRSEIVAVEVLEAGKPWIEADNDVGEAIDFCHYYAIWLERLAAERLDSPAGETNSMRYRPRGLTAVIPPWNFPLAIPMGMTAAALAMGNPVILKPAEQTPLVASYLARAFDEAGLPKGALALVFGQGETVGAALVRHPEVTTIAFTGSRAVGLEIMRAASEVVPGQRSLKRVIAELGGKNAIIVDQDADLDQAVPGVLYSAFGFAGQKCSACSRVVVHRHIAKAFTERLAEAARTLIVGDPRDPATQMGPVIDEEARSRITRMIEEGRSHTKILFEGTVPELPGYFVPPTIFVDPDRTSALYREEIFGPVLTVEVADDLEDAIWRANDTIYGLTQGVFSRSASAIAKAADAARAGNFYINRPITGAIPGRHPFGGMGHSGVGYKAGGPSYLLQFADAQVISENLLRQGFSPDISE
jgi:RHH-type proline utilization regulon transcriptional repressor/proline dehydrogenase/delta 1-pyrroline-5-carboxylate dehydrogenase